MSRKICVITGTRAEYGLLRWLMQGIKDDTELTLQIIATGTHLSPEFGLTYREIESDGFSIDRKVEMLTSSDTAVGVIKSMGLGMIGFADALDELKPDMLVVLGDRFEILAAVSSALIAGIPTAHLHGGELTEGAFDDAIRHSITKMSHLHFVAAEDYRQRVIQLGEQPDRVFLVGGLGIENIKRLKLLGKKELEAALGIEFLSKNLLITFHPATLQQSSAQQQMEALLLALSELRDTRLIFTMPNADPEGRTLIGMVERFVQQHPNACSFTSLGQLRYLSCIAHVDGVVGNSSSGLLEVPSFKKGTINIGDRQRGRLQAGSVINCVPTHAAIRQALQTLFSADFQASMSKFVNPDGDANASEKIIDVIRRFPLLGIVKKVFHDLPPLQDLRPSK
jgi:GDP/UDP-N,N'-diacetylbacillosamine 2-epimerase (hydrolysing)